MEWAREEREARRERGDVEMWRCGDGDALEMEMWMMVFQLKLLLRN